jgi:hypothetical protein
MCLVPLLMLPFKVRSVECCQRGSERIARENRASGVHLLDCSIYLLHQALVERHLNCSYWVLPIVRMGLYRYNRPHVVWCQHAFDPFVRDLRRETEDLRMSDEESPSDEIRKFM